MRALFLTSISGILLSGCLTTQENPNYEHSTVYRGDPVSSTQYASTAPVTAAPSVDISNATYDPVTSQYIFADQASTSAASYQQPAPHSAAPLYAHPAPVVSELPPSFNTASTASSATAFATAPTDSAFASQEVTGTPGFMALQNSQQTVAQAQLAPPLPAAQAVPNAPLRAAGTPVPYDYSRNLITADTVTTGQQIPDSVRVLQGAPQNYIVQPGDTVYSLSRRTCVGVNVIQSMNGLGEKNI